MSHALSSSRRSGADTARPALGGPEFRRVADLLLAEAGIELTPEKRLLAQSRLQGRLRVLRLDSYADYCDFVESPAGAAERMEMLSALTTNVTQFLREPHHFDYLRTDILPALVRRMDRGVPVRCWSAGCATGEEPYTLALTLLRAVPDIDRRDCRILATDIDPAALRTAAAGCYSARTLTRMPPDLRERYFRPDASEPGTWEVGPELRRLVKFRQLNLIAPWPFVRPFDVIMCRNVAIYFSPEIKRQVWSRLVRQLRPGGWLITGHSERLSDEAATQTEPLFTTTYRRKMPDSPPEERTECH